jgi:hypothetical protein
MQIWPLRKIVEEVLAHGNQQYNVIYTVPNLQLMTVAMGQSTGQEFTKDTMVLENKYS